MSTLPFLLFLIDNFNRNWSVDDNKENEPCLE